MDCEERSNKIDPLTKGDDNPLKPEKSRLTTLRKTNEEILLIDLGHDYIRKKT